MCACFEQNENNGRKRTGKAFSEEPTDNLNFLKQKIARLESDVKEKEQKIDGLEKQLKLKNELSKNRAKFMEDYRVEDNLGSGLGGSVFKARVKFGDLPCAVKRIALDKRDIETGLSEVRALGQLDDPNIVKFNIAWPEEQPEMSQYGPDDELLKKVHQKEQYKSNYRRDNILIFIQMQLAESTLHKWLSENREPQSRKLSGMKWFFKQIARGVKHLHSRGFIHRDIKPHNILMFEGGTRLKICDMGIVVRREIVGGKEIAICHNEVVSPDYASPEQISALREIDSKSDVFTLGLIHAELCTVMDEKREIFDNYRNGTEHLTFGSDCETAAFVSRLTDMTPKNRPSCLQLLEDPYLAKLSL